MSEGISRLADRALSPAGGSAMQRALKLISYKEYCTKALRERLLGEGHDAGDVEAVVGELVEVGAVDDLRYAEVFIRSKANSGYGRNYIERELERLDIPLDSIPELTDLHLNDDAELARAIHVLLSYHGKARDLRGALMNRLANKGFRQSVSIAAVSHVLRDA